MEAPICIQDKEVASIGAGLTSLISVEQMDRASPELWPESVPEVRDFPPRLATRQPEWMGEFNRDDIKLLAGLSTMTAPGLVAEVKKLYDTAYKIGVEESREITRGKLLKVLSRNEVKEESSKTVT